jgi:Acyl-CoA carboxylase epsilon subunit
VTSSRPEQAADPRPLLRVVSGNPTDEELAALVAVLVGLQAARAAQPIPRPGRSAWSDPRRRLRGADYREPGAWVASARPR